MKEYVYIHSTESIVVTAGLQYEDHTKQDSDIANRMKIAPVWPKLKMLIKKGKFIYPSIITEWNTVKVLVKEGILTIGEELDNPNDNTIEEKNSDLKAELAALNKKPSKKHKDVSLDDVAE